MNGLGDHLLNLPAVRALAATFPGTLRLVCVPGARDTFFSDLQFASVIEPRTHGFDGEFYDYRFNAPEVAATLGDADLFICLNPVPGQSSGELSRVLGARWSVGFDATFSVPQSVRFDLHSADLAFSVVKAIEPSIDIDAFAGPPALPVHAVRRADAIMRTVPQGWSAVAVHGDTKPEKTWSAAGWRELLERLLATDPQMVIFDVGLTPLVVDGRVAERVVPCGSLDVATAMALVGRAELFVGVDSCFLHAADLYRVPGVGLFGPTEPREFGFRFGPHRHLRRHPTLGNLEAQEVFAAVSALRAESG
jgi:ADP-heptose:LPS heptosyltransferase